jgi:hypothetical protein
MGKRMLGWEEVREPMVGSFSGGGDSDPGDGDDWYSDLEPLIGGGTYRSTS